MLNDCPTCKWCIGQACDKELVSGESWYDNMCTCPEAVKISQTYVHKISGVHLCLRVSNSFEVGLHGCAYTPKEESIITTNNQGRTICFKCNTPTIKVSTGMFTVYDVCPVCKI